MFNKRTVFCRYASGFDAQLKNAIYQEILKYEKEHVLNVILHILICEKNLPTTDCH